jgi:hypothetical protein
MRNLLIALLLVCASAGAQNVNELPLFGEAPKSKETMAADQRFIDSAVRLPAQKKPPPDWKPFAAGGT